MVKITKKEDTVLRKKYGIGIHQYMEMLARQDGKCYICKQASWRKLAVDHCHTTGDIRGLLCAKCNMAIGLFKDDVSILAKAIEYLNESFVVPIDVEVVMKPHKDRARWRNIVETPDGKFDSMEAAGRYYNVHPTTVGQWCGRYKSNGAPSKTKDGFKMSKIFK